MENSGDFILTQDFRVYKERRRLNLHICRKSDPESKGKIENVVKYKKHNFAKHLYFASKLYTTLQNRIHTLATISA